MGRSCANCALQSEQIVYLESALTAQVKNTDYAQAKVNLFKTTKEDSDRRAENLQGVVKLLLEIISKCTSCSDIMKEHPLNKMTKPTFQFVFFNFQLIILDCLT